MLLNKVFIFIGLGFIYVAFSLLISISSNNNLSNNFFIDKLFAEITFDAQDSAIWFNSNNPTATVSVDPAVIPIPVSITVITRRSH